MFNFWSEMPDSYKKMGLMPKIHQKTGDKILYRLHAYSPGRTRKDIIYNSGVRRKTAQQALAHLIRLCIVERSGKGVRGNPYIYYFR